MKKMMLSLFAACAICSMSAQELAPIALNAPDKTAGCNVMKAFAARQSTREFSTEPLTTQELSNLLWAANGINRAEKGMRTAPSAMNSQEVDVYVCMEKGAYLYDAKANRLVPIVAEDLRGLVAGRQESVKEAPVILLMVSDLSRLRGGDTEHGRLMAAIDVGIVSQNISLACAGLGLITVPRGSMETEALKNKLQLKETQLLLMNNPVGKKK